MRSLYTLAAVAALSTAAVAQSPLVTLNAANNGGAPGGAVYFDLTVNVDITITNLKLNCNGGTADNVEVYIVPGATYAGNENLGNAFWGAAPTASGTITAINPTGVLSDCPIAIPLSAGVYAVAIANGAGHAYTNGDGTNQQHTTTELTLDAGSATNVALTGNVFNPRVWNGEIEYGLGSSGTIATATKSGTGCGGSPFGDGTFYEEFLAGNDLTGFTLTWNGTGYDYANSANAIVPPSGAGALVFGDDQTQEVPLGFALPSPAGNDTSVWVCSNGYISFEATNAADFSQSIAELLANESRLCPLWTDLNPSAGGTIDAEAVGSDFVVTYSAVPAFGTTNSNNVQIVFSPNGNIEVRYGQIDQQDSIVGVTTGNGATDPGGMDLSASGGFTVTTGQFTPTFDISAGDRPVLGTNATVNIEGEAVGAVSALLVGVPTGGIELTVAGFPGCFLYTSPIATVAGNSVAVPNNASLIGANVSVQAASIGPGLYPNNVVSSGEITWGLGDL